MKPSALSVTFSVRLKKHIYPVTNYACHIDKFLFTFAWCWILATVGRSYLLCVHLTVTLAEFGCIKQAGEQTFSSLSLPLIMSFSGKYQQVSQENFEPFMKAVGKNSASF